MVLRVSLSRTHAGRLGWFLSQIFWIRFRQHAAEKGMTPQSGDMAVIINRYGDKRSPGRLFVTLL
jgi:hypothetical protein